MRATGAYHHGDLRAALIAAARAALETTPPEAISLKSLATGLGVSQPAPYRHFGNREALLAAVAAQGFEQFRAELAAAAEGRSEQEGFERSCLAYLSFGRANAGLYRLMFASRLLKTAQDETLKAAAAAAFGFLLERTARRAASGDADTTAIWVWSTLHGLVMLEAEDLVSGPHKELVGPVQVVHRMAEALAQR